MKNGLNASGNHEAKSTIMGAILRSEKFMCPIYWPTLKSDEDCNRLQGILPLVYIWNEKSIGTELHFELSINGSIIATLLESIMPRSDPNFDHTRDAIMQDLAKMSKGCVLQICTELGAPPSEVFVLKGSD
jgi:hypothetical protein